MQIVYRRCGGMDVHKKSVVVCLLLIDESTGEERKERRTFGTTTRALLELAAWLTQWRVETVAIKSTGVYWKPVWNVLEEELGAGCKLMLVNARHFKQVPGRKTDQKDAEWLAELRQHGLMRASFVPPPATRQLRDLTRSRTSLMEDHTAVANRLQKLLEEANMKLSSAASNVLGVSGRRMLKELAKGNRDAAELADSFIPDCMPVYPGAPPVRPCFTPDTPWEYTSFEADYRKSSLSLTGAVIGNRNGRKSG